MAQANENGLLRSNLELDFHVTTRGAVEAIEVFEFVSVTLRQAKDLSGRGESASAS